MNNPELTYDDAMDTLDTLAAAIHKNAVEHGFYEEDAATRKLLGLVTVPFVSPEALIANHEQNECLKRLALIASEVGETVEAVRKPGFAHHISLTKPPTSLGDEQWPKDANDFTQEEEEIADVIIRCLDYAAFRKLRIGTAVLKKMEYNASRPHKHGKRS